MPPRRRQAPHRYQDEESIHGSGGNAPPGPPPPPMPNMGQFVAALMAAIPALRERMDIVRCSSAFFSRQNSLEFFGEEGPMMANDWITSHEDLTEMLGCTESQKVVYASLKLKGEANYWWKSKKLDLTREYGQGVPIPWECFKQEFNDRFFPRAQRQQCARDFQDLKQRAMSIEHYAAEFQKLSRYSPSLVPDEETKAKRFRDGLTPHILERIIFLKMTDFTDMVHTATMAEKRIRVAAADFVSKKRLASTGAPLPPPSKRQSGSSSAGSQGRMSTYSSQGSGSRL
jgi:hypothetical protein